MHTYLKSSGNSSGLDEAHMLLYICPCCVHIYMGLGDVGKLKVRYILYSSSCMISMVHVA